MIGANPNGIVASSPGLPRTATLVTPPILARAEGATSVFRCHIEKRPTML